MLFSEVYGAYFRTVESVLSHALAGDLTGKKLSELVRQSAFEESVLTIPAALTDGSWPLLRSDRTTPLRHPPAMPLTLLEKRWLKALLLDPRIRLFMPPVEGLEGIEPLYDPEVFVFYDRYTDGDPYDDPRYIECFRMILRAMEGKRALRVRFYSSRDRRHSIIYVPYSLEYSAKDNKFRLLSACDGKVLTVNLARIRSVQILEPFAEEMYRPADYREKSVTLLLTDERNALERVLLHFSDLEKETEQLGERRYRVLLQYKQGDETELLIRILSFGPMLQVIEPDSIRELLRERIEKQCALQERTEKNADAPA